MGVSHIDMSTILESYWPIVIQLIVSTGWAVLTVQEPNVIVIVILIL